ncbi:choice-of-anchor Q domain-containing protein [Gemmata sp. JC717]|uniref:YDG domain-containing protein n=1 Tax=Gemmata algarum TaxID=2975278 RepID=UPI0021BB0505|nr:YDG domain-containing protein [Gemmata algarum]MDY3551876.1 choice-of-anchor Q domain-containing protein [Gemmata algarum]
MPVRSWVRKLFDRTPARPIVRPRPKLAVEALEDRAVPATFAVTSLLDNGSSGTLRWAVDQANGTAGADTITFAPGVAGGTIVLTGGQLALTDSAQTTIDGGAAGVTLDGNNTSRLVFVSPGASAALNRLTITRGRAGNLDGGGILNSGGTLAVSASTITNNAANFGGGISNFNGTLTVTGSTVANNVGNFGGGIYSTGSAAVTASTIANNSAGNAGGGILNSGGTLTVSASTIANNSAGGAGGGGIYNSGGTATLASAILTDAFGGDNLSASSANNLLVGSGSVGGLSNGANGNVVVPTVAAAGLDPAGLRDNGGPTQTIALLSTSPAIGAGPFAGGATVDQRGYGRPAAGNIDLGAYQTTAAPREADSLVVTTTADAVNAFDGVTSLREAVAYANAHAGADTITFAPGVAGGTIVLTGGQLTLSDSAQTIIDGGAAGVTLDGNNASRVLFVGYGASAALNHLTITRGRGDGSGGGIYNQGTLTVSASTIAGNRANYGSGGGIYNRGTLTVSASTIAGNRSIDSGGIYNRGTLTVSASAIVGNSAVIYAGICNDAGVLTVSTSTINNNSADNSYGGIYNSGSAVVTASTIANNSGSNAGGIQNSGDTLTVSASTITNNAGGGISNSSGATTTLTSTILTDGFVGYNGLSASSANNLLVGSGSVGGLSNGANGNVVVPTVAAAGLDPAGLKDNGGPTQTIALLPGSPAVGGAATSAGATDQRGVARDARPDIGAFEFTDFRPSLVVTTLADEDDGTSDSRFGSGTSLREAVAYANAHPGADTITFAPGVAGGTIVLSRGQLALTDAAQTTIDGGAAGVTLDANNASRVVRVYDRATAALNHLTITRGNADNSDGGIRYYGGGILNQGTLTVSASTITTNNAPFGGGISNWVTMTVTGSTVANNVGNFGGGIYNSGSAAVTASTIANNSGGNAGGIQNSGGTLTVSASTIANNTARNGYAGINNFYSRTTLTSTMLTDAFGGDDLSASSANNLLVGSGAVGGLSGGANGNVVVPTAAAAGLDPAGLKDNGGPTQTIALLPTSPAIGAGPFGAAGATVDQRGYGRPAAGNIDLGAYQTTAAPREADSLVVTTTADAVNAFDGVTSLREAVAYANAHPGADTITFAPGVAGGTIVLTGGQLALTDADQTTIDGGAAGVTLDGNNASRVIQVNYGATATLNRLTITRGRADNYDGGGIYNQGTLTVSASTITNNGAHFGGGISNYGTLTVSASTITNNRGYFGGGIFNHVSATVTASTIANNYADNSGGGIHNVGGTIAVTASTITNNGASLWGGGVYSSGATTTLTSTILTDGFGGNSNLSASSANNLLVGSGSVGGLSNGANGNVVVPTVAATGLDPAGLRDNGGPTQTIALLPTSPAIGAGMAGAGATDQRGVARDTRPDIGAYEFVAYRPSLVVTTLADEDDGTSDPGFGSGTSLREAVAYANAHPGADTITFAPGVAGGTIVLSRGQLALTDADQTTIDGGAAGVTLDGNNASRVFSVSPGASAALNHLTITRGRAANASGGGIVSQGTLTVTASTITNNSASTTGGGIFNQGTLTVSASTINNNAATSGAAIYNSTGSVNVTTSTIANNSAHFFGGGIYNYDGTLTVSASTIDNNSTEIAGGGMYSSGGTLTVSASTFANNSVLFGKGGGIALDGGTLTVSASTINNNAAGNTGGGIHNQGTLIVTASTVANNSSHSMGGGIHNQGTLIVASSTIANNYNTYTLEGDGLHNFGAIGGTATLTNTILADGFAGDDLSALSANNLLVGSGSVGGLSGGVNGNVVVPTVAAAGLDPAGLRDNGGPTQTIALLPGSPAVGGAATSAGATDQRGVARDARPDIGAFEFTDFRPSLVVTTLADEDDGTSDPGFGSGTSLREALAYANAHPGADTITFAPGVAGGTIVLTGGQLALTDSAQTTIDGGAAGVTLDGNNASRLVFVDTGASAALNHLTITRGRADNDSGGGISNQGTLAVSASTITNNAARFGGGISNQGTLTVSASTIANNSANRIGGGIYNFGSTAVTASTIANNTADNAGGIYNVGGTLTMSASTVANNSANFVGGISTLGSTLTMSASTVANNSANSAGGGIYSLGGTLTLSASTIANNLSRNIGGGGIYSSGSTLRMSASTVANNSVLSGNGGGIYLDGAILTVSASTIANNSADLIGGGIYNSRGVLTVSASTIANNSASNGGGIFNQGMANLPRTTLTSTILTDGFAGDDLSASSANNLLVGSGSVGGLSSGANGNVVVPTVAAAGLDPAGLKDNGGPTQTIALLSTSPAIGAGVGGAGAADQRGVARNANPDIGSFEAQASTVGVTIAGGVYRGTAYTVTAATVADINGATIASFGSPALTYTYYAGALTAAQVAAATPLAGAPINVGTYTVVATFTSDAAGYRNAVSSPVSFAITPATAFVVVADSAFIYDGQAHGPTTVDAVGVGGADLSGFVSLSTLFTDAPGGVATWTFDAGPNYVSASGSVSIIISPRVVSWVTDAAGKTYGDADAASLTTGAGSGFVEADGVTATYTRQAGENAGTYAITATLSSSRLTAAQLAANYFVINTGAVYTIGRRAASVSADALTKVYGDADPVLTGTLSGFLPGDGVSAAYTRAAGESVAGGPYAVTATLNPSAALANYDVTYTAGSLTVTPRVLTVTATAGNKVYDGTTAASATLTLGNAAPGESPTATFTSAVFADKNAGVGKAVTVSGIALDPAFAANYTLNGVTTAFSAAARITAKAISGTFTAADKVYDGGAAATVLSRSLGGVIGQDAVTLTGGTAAFADKNAGAGKTVSLTGAALTGADAANYTLTGVSTTTASITKRALTVTATASDKVYDGTTAASAGLVLGNAVAGEAPAATFTSAVFGDKNAGTGKTVTVSGVALDPAFAANYTLSGVTTAGAVASITAKAISGTFTAADKVYDGTRAATVLTRNLGGVIGQDAVTLTGGTAAFADKNAGAGKAVTLTGATLTGADAGNYTLTGVAGAAASIAKRALTVGATASDKVYDGTTAASAGLVLGNAVAGEAPAATFTSAVFGDKNAGTGKTVTVSGIALDPAFTANYTLSGVTTAGAVASITAKAISGTFTAADKVYDGTRAATVLTRNLGGVIGQDAVTLTGGTAAFADKNAGAGKTVTLTGATLTGADAANYTLTGVGATTAGIAKRALTITATGANKVFDGTTAAAVTLADNRVVGDQLASGYTSAAFADPNVGTGKSVTVTGISVTGADAGNYTFNTSATTTASITPAAVTIGLVTDRPVAVPGLAVTFTATVAAANGAPVTGIVTFKDGSTVLGTAPVVNGKAVLTTDAFQYGNKTITATFAGGANYAVPTAAASVGVSVVPAAILPDPVTGQNALFVGGTAGDDEIEVLGLCNNRYAVEVESGCWKLFDQTLTGAVARVVMYGGAGNDSIVANGDVRVPVFAFGGAGNDILVGTAGAPNVLVGGAGNDLLYAGCARDILIGGAGSDLLFGQAGDDMLIGGSTAFDANESALWGLQAEWNSSRDLGTRVANLKGTGTGPRANGNAFLVAGGPSATVFNDGAGDFLYGGSGRDWYFANTTGGGVLDVVAGLRGDDLLTEL